MGKLPRSSLPDYLDKIWAGCLWPIAVRRAHFWRAFPRNSHGLHCFDFGLLIHWPLQLQWTAFGLRLPTFSFTILCNNVALLSGVSWFSRKPFPRIALENQLEGALMDLKTTWWRAPRCPSTEIELKLDNFRRRDFWTNEHSTCEHRYPNIWTTMQRDRPPFVQVLRHPWVPLWLRIM